jgi:hypothetical protein
MADPLNLEASLAKLNPDARTRVEKALRDALAKEQATLAARVRFDRSYDRQSLALADSPELAESKE